MVPARAIDLKTRRRSILERAGIPGLDRHIKQFHGFASARGQQRRALRHGSRNEKESRGWISATPRIRTAQTSTRAWFSVYWFSFATELIPFVSKKKKRKTSTRANEWQRSGGQPRRHTLRTAHEPRSHTMAHNLLLHTAGKLGHRQTLIGRTRTGPRRWLTLEE